MWVSPPAAPSHMHRLLDQAPGEMRDQFWGEEAELQRHTCADEPGEMHRGRELGGPRPAGYGGESTRNAAALGLGQNLSHIEWWGTGTLGGSSSVGWCRIPAGAQEAEERPEMH